MSAAVSIVIVTFNSAHVIEGLLDSLPAALDGLEAEIVVVDNDSTDLTRDVLARRSECRVVPAPNDGYAAGINAGVAASLGSGPILVLNPDVRMTPRSIGPMVAALDRPGVGIVAPRVVGDDGRLVLSMRREPTLRRALGLGATGRPLLSEYVTQESAYDVEQVCDWALGAVLLVARRCDEDLGGWDASYFLYSEETDFCLRARDLGWRTLYLPTVSATHIGAQSGQSNRIHAMQILNRVRLYRRRHGEVAGLAYLMLTVLSEASWVVRGHRQSLTAIHALLRPSRRPHELGMGDHLVPR